MKFRLQIRLQELRPRRATDIISEEPYETIQFFNFATMNVTIATLAYAALKAVLEVIGVGQ